MRFRKLRIAWSVGCTIACVLLIALWARSYWWSDSVCKESVADLKCVHIQNGQFRFQHRAGLVIAPQPGWHHQSTYNPVPTSDLLLIPYFAYDQDEFYVPIWSVAFQFAILAAASIWLPMRFRLRTMLLATTLVAVVLGVIVWAAR